MQKLGARSLFAAFLFLGLSVIARATDDPNEIRCQTKTNTDLHKQVSAHLSFVVDYDASEKCDPELTEVYDSCKKTSGSSQTVANGTVDTQQSGTDKLKTTAANAAAAKQKAAVDLDNNNKCLKKVSDAEKSCVTHKFHTKDDAKAPLEPKLNGDISKFVSHIKSECEKGAAAANKIIQSLQSTQDAANQLTQGSGTSGSSGSTDNSGSGGGTTSGTSSSTSSSGTSGSSLGDALNSPGGGGGGSSAGGSSAGGATASSGSAGSDMTGTTAGAGSGFSMPEGDGLNELNAIGTQPPIPDGQIFDESKKTGGILDSGPGAVATTATPASTLASTASTPATIDLGRGGGGGPSTSTTASTTGGGGGSGGGSSGGGGGGSSLRYADSGLPSSGGGGGSYGGGGLEGGSGPGGNSLAGNMLSQTPTGERTSLLATDDKDKKSAVTLPPVVAAKSRGIAPGLLGARPLANVPRRSLASITHPESGNNYDSPVPDTRAPANSGPIGGNTGLLTFIGIGSVVSGIAARRRYFS